MQNLNYIFKLVDELITFLLEKLYTINRGKKTNFYTIVVLM